MRSKCRALRVLVTASAVVLGGTVALAGDLDSTSTITGTATYRERMALPPGAVLEVTLEDISRADAPAAVIGQARIESPGSPPFPFSISFDPARVQQGHRYAVRARITLNGQSLFTTDTVHPVLGAGDRTSVDLMLRRAGSGATAVAPPAKAAPGEPARRIRGAYSYMADAGFFTDCRSGQRLPMEGDRPQPWPARRSKSSNASAKRTSSCSLPGIGWLDRAAAIACRAATASRGTS